MTRKPLAFTRLSAALLALAAGCSDPPPDKGEEEVKQAFASLQKAMADRDADKIWQLLDADSQADAERQAKSIREAYVKADEAKRKEEEKKMGLSGKELEKLDGVGFLETLRFQGMHDEIHDGTLDKVTLSGKDRATVHYTERDKDKETLSFVKEKGGWKVSLPMNKGS